MFFKLFTILALAASPALATVFITNPTAATTFHGGQNATISWQDDGTAPSLQDFGNAMVSIYVGNAQQQTSLQTIVPSVNVATTSSIQFTPDPTIGPDSPDYFIRVQSLTATDPKNPQFPALAFSAKFLMDGMTGQFNASVEAQIAGQSTAPLNLGGQTSAGPAVPTNQPSFTTSTRASSTASSTAKAPSSTPNSALHSTTGWAGIALSVLVGIASF